MRLPATDSTSSSVVEATLCSYVVDNYHRISFWLGLDPNGFYRLVYRGGKNGSNGTLPVASARAHDDDDLIDDDKAGEREERRLMATEESRQRYGLRDV